MNGIIFSVLMVVSCRYFMDFLFSWGPYTSTYVRYVKSIMCIQIFSVILQNRRPNSRTKSRKSLAIHSHLYSFYSSVTLHCKGKNLIEMDFYQIFSSFLPSYPLPYRFKKSIHAETSSLKTLKIMPRNLSGIACSWIVHEFGFGRVY